MSIKRKVKPKVMKEKNSSSSDMTSHSNQNSLFCSSQSEDTSTRSYIREQSNRKKVENQTEKLMCCASCLTNVNEHNSIECQCNRVVDDNLVSDRSLKNNELTNSLDVRSAPNVSREGEKNSKIGTLNSSSALHDKKSDFNQQFDQFTHFTRSLENRDIKKKENLGASEVQKEVNKKAILLELERVTAAATNVHNFMLNKGADGTLGDYIKRLERIANDYFYWNQLLTEQTRSRF